MSLSLRRAAAALGVAALVGLTPMVPARTAAAQPSTVSVNLLDMTPSTPVTGKPIDFRVLITNNTGNTLSGLAIQGVRSAVLGTTTELTGAFKTPITADPNTLGYSRGHVQPIKGTLAAGQRMTVTYAATTSQTDQTDLCLCNTGIYPYDLIVTASTSDGSTTQVGDTQTFVPSFITKPAPVQVGWVWPLLERPHRLSVDDVFADDDLATSIAPGGRLYRALTVAEEVAGKVRLTLVIDPELIDELAVMSSHTGYRVQIAPNKTKPGTGGEAARNWLALLRAILPQHDVIMTPYADPDVDAVARAGGSWSSTMPAAMQTRVTAALGGTYLTDIYWPAGGTITSAAANQLAGQRVSTFILNDSSFSNANQDPPLSALAPMSDTPGAPRAAVVNSADQTQVDAVLDTGGSGQLPKLVSLIAMRAVQNPQASPYVALTPSRYVDVPVASARRAILDTAHTAWSAPMSIRQAFAAVSPVSHGEPKTPPDAVNKELPTSITATTAGAAQFVRSFSTALSTQDVPTQLGQFPAAIQRAESSAWRDHPQLGAVWATALQANVEQIRNSVSVVTPARGVYSLTSSDAPLFVTVHNQLPVNVKVRVAVSTPKYVSGLRTDDIGAQIIPARTTRHLKIPTHVERTGRFQVQVYVTTPDGAPLGTPVPLTVRATILGVIGVVITAVAGGVLVLALTIRFVRRFRSRRPPTAVPPASDSGSTRAPAGAAS